MSSPTPTPPGLSGTPPLIAELQAKHETLQNKLTSLINTHEEFAGLPDQMASLVTDVQSILGVLEKLDLSPNHGSTAIMAPFPIVSGMHALKRQNEILTEANARLSLQLADSQNSNRDLASRTLALERALQDENREPFIMMRIATDWPFSFYY